MAVTEIYRSIGQDPYNPDWESDGSMMSRMELTSPRNLLRILRAGLLIRLLRNKPFIVWATICAAGDARRSWLRAVRDDLSWYDGKHEFFDGFGTISLRDAFAKIIKHTKQFKRCVLLICSQLANNIAEAWAKCKADVSICSDHRCEMCTMNFQSTQELAVHNFRVHHVCRQMRRLVDTLHCIFCMQYFHTREIFICHLEEKSKRCKNLFNLCCTPLGDLEFRNAETEAAEAMKRLTKQGWRRHKALQPVFRISGPMPAVSELAGISHFIGLKGSFL